MELTKENYIIACNSIKRENNIIKFIKNNKIAIIVLSVFSGLVIAEVLLLVQFINLLMSI